MTKVAYIGMSNALLQNLLQVNQYDIEQFRHPLEFSKSKEKDNFEVFFIEYNLPGVNGLDWISLSGIDIQNPKRLVFLVAENISKELRIKALKTGIDDIFTAETKPESIAQRIAFLRNHKSTLKKTTNSNSFQKYKIPLIKRIFDIAVASTILLIASPVLIIVIILIRLESKGKVYYISKRVGTGYQVFDFYKLRSMSNDADKKLLDLAKSNNQYAQPTNATEEAKCQKCEELGHPCSQILYIDGKEICENFYIQSKKQKSESAFIKIKDDPRITKIGKFIRNTSIDELPQLINVIKGDMSIVGNRPLPLYEAELLTTDNWTERFIAPAGITGLWQVMARGRSEKMSTEERKELDNIYARDCSFWKDIKIILMTVPALLQKENV